jgi:hypothetical protein
MRLGLIDSMRHAWAGSAGVDTIPPSSAAAVRCRSAAALSKWSMSHVCRCIPGTRKQARLAQERFGPAGHGESPPLALRHLSSPDSAAQFASGGRGARQSNQSTASPTSDGTPVPTGVSSGAGSLSFAVSKGDARNLNDVCRSPFSPLYAVQPQRMPRLRSHRASSNR